MIGDAETIWCEANIGAVASAAVNLDLYGPGTTDPVVVLTTHDGSSETMTMSGALPIIMLGAAVGPEEPTTMRVTRGMRDAWRNVDRAGYERSCAAAFALR